MSFSSLLLCTTWHLESCWIALNHSDRLVYSVLLFSDVKTISKLLSEIWFPSWRISYSNPSTIRSDSQEGSFKSRKMRTEKNMSLSSPSFDFDLDLLSSWLFIFASFHKLNISAQCHSLTRMDSNLQCFVPVILSQLMLLAIIISPTQLSARLQQSWVAHARGALRR